jgi:hypothetical protein
MITGDVSLEGESLNTAEDERMVRQVSLPMIRKKSETYSPPFIKFDL